MGCGASSKPAAKYDSTPAPVAVKLPPPPASVAPASVTPTSSPPSSPRPEAPKEAPRRHSGGGPHKLRACKYGSGCYQRNIEHLRKFVHPGDRNYRIGQISFGADQKPDLQTVWQLFSFHDADESGYLGKDDFQPLYEYVARLMESEIGDLDACWEKVNQNQHLNFSGMVIWSQELGIPLPIGLDDVNENRPCRFKVSKRGDSEDDTQERCSCPNFEVAEDGFLCKCGHKPSMHRSDHAEASASVVQEVPDWWAEDQKGLVPVEDEELVGQLQAFLEATHKEKDNWTRDRGCKLHGRHHPECNFHCAWKNQEPVPNTYKLKKVLRNQNIDLWTKYHLMRSSISDECARESDCKYQDADVLSKGDLDAPVIDGCNEWRLLHGTSIKACCGICSTNFRLALAGTGATWKDPGKEKGSPLYGFGIYLAERVTKADEYSAQVVPEDLQSAVGPELAATLEPIMSDGEVFCMLVVRCVGGKANIVETNDIDKEKLKSDVFDGPYHSVFGDRVKTLGKPYREIVVYDKDQCYPEFILLYERGFGG